MLHVYCALDSLYFKSEEVNWWKGDLVPIVIKALADSGFPTEFKFYSFYGEDGEEKHKFTPDSEVKKLFNKFHDITFFPGPDEYPSIFLTRNNESFRMLTRTEGKTIGEAASWFEKFVKLIHESLGDRVWLGPHINVWVDMPMPSLRPRRQHDYLSMGISWDFISHDTLKHLQQPRVADVRDRHLREFEILAHEPLPDGARREWIDDLLIIKWVNEETKEEEIREGEAHRARWLLRHIELEIDPEYTKEGDELVLRHGMAKHRNVTFYAAAGEIAYQTAVAFDGQIDPELVALWKGWLKQGKLPDNSPLQDLTVIVPNRETAITVYQQLMEAGVDRVLYVGEEGMWWDPFPEGDWIEPDDGKE